MAKLLRREYGLPERGAPQGLIASVVRTILSQNTTAANTDAAYNQLRARFPDWQSLARARHASIEAAIRKAGLASKRAPVLREVVRRLLEAEEEGLSAERLRALPTEHALQFLQSLKGIGPKTAACVALFELGRDVFPVDTHILRIGKRLGWLGPEVHAEEAQRFLEPRLPAPLRLQLHVNLIRHGRETCRARNPLCRDCVLRKVCPTDETAKTAGRDRRI